MTDGAPVILKKVKVQPLDQKVLELVASDLNFKAPTSMLISNSILLVIFKEFFDLPLILPNQY